MLIKVPSPYRSVQKLLMENRQFKVITVDMPPIVKKTLVMSFVPFYLCFLRFSVVASDSLADINFG